VYNRFMGTDVKTELNRGALPAAELRERLDVSPATLMRIVREAGPEILRIGRGRATQYGLREVWPNLDNSRFPMFRISESGRAVSAGELITLAFHQTAWIPMAMVVNGLPPEVADARPSGFLGRHFAAANADLKLPPRLTDWSDHHILLAMSRRGEDLPGNLIIGEESFARWQELRPVSRSRDDYPALAEATIKGHPPGSSAGGERPKFGVLVGDRHMLVKFAGRGGVGDVVARRWCDLLILEELALHTAASHGIPAANTNVIETPDCCFLESERFDRVGVRGRIAVTSLAAVHDDLADPWARAAVALKDARRLSDEDARRICWLDAFGALIANTDRHQYNILFFPESSQLRLAPAFDQVSMLYAPTGDGQVPPRDFALPHATANTLDVWEDASGAAREFWEQGSQDMRLSDDARLICGNNLKLFAQ
jgi:HipA-like C-terminal domain